MDSLLEGQELLDGNDILFLQNGETKQFVIEDEAVMDKGLSLATIHSGDILCITYKVWNKLNTQILSVSKAEQSMSEDLQMKRGE